MLKVVKLSMKNFYHYRYLADGSESEDELFIGVDSFFPDDDRTYKDICALLDQQRYDIGSSVIRKIVEFAGEYKNTR